jgi:hypothetical protein
MAFIESNPVSEIYLDFAKYGIELTNDNLAGIAFEILGISDRLVAVKSGNLRASGKVEQEGLAWVVSYSTEYAAAQEFGLAPYGKPNYTFTPYMRPAAQRVSSPENLQRIALAASANAKRKSQKRERL